MKAIRTLFTLFLRGLFESGFRLVDIVLMILHVLHGSRMYEFQLTGVDIETTEFGVEVERDKFIVSFPVVDERVVFVVSKNPVPSLFR